MTATDKGQILNKADELLLKDISATERSLLSAILRIVDKLPQKDGKFVKDPANFKLIMRLNKLIAQALKKSTLSKKTEKFLKKFQDIAKANLRMFDEGHSEAFKNAIERDSRAAMALTADEITDTKAGVENPLRRALFNAVVLGAGVEATRNVLRNLLNGGGLVAKHVRKSTDKLAEFDGQVVKKIADKYEYNAFRYVGSIIDNSRIFCKGMVGQNDVFSDLTLGRGVFLIESIPQIIDRGLGMPGFDPNTTPSNFFQKRGGYNCRHQVIPFRMSDREYQNALTKLGIRQAA